MVLSNNKKRKAKQKLAIERKEISLDDKIEIALNNLDMSVSKRQLVIRWTFGHSNKLIKLIRIVSVIATIVSGGGFAAVSVWEWLDVLF